MARRLPRRTNRTGDGGDRLRPDDGSEQFLALRPRLLGIAYRMLGSMWDAEDVVADAMERWLRTDREQIVAPAAFLTTVVSRLALDHLRRARVTRETYTGPWLPEPVIVDTELLDPLDTIVSRETLSLATLRLMEQLTPPERAVFVLREAFDIPYAQVAEILDVSVAQARQLRHRADRKLEQGRRRAVADTHEHAELLDRLLAATGSGELDRLGDLLAADVIAYSDGGGKARAARRPIVGRKKVVAFITGLMRKFGPSPSVVAVSVNATPAVRLTIGGQQQLVALEVADGEITSIFTVLNPDKLSYLDRQMG